MPVLNKHHLPGGAIPADAIYIGRGSRWGNPFIIGHDGNRDSVCDQYETWLGNRIDSGTISLEALASLHGKKLVCFCAPLRCHGDTLVRAAEWAVQELKEQA
jgi:hypothetical protein